MAKPGKVRVEVEETIAPFTMPGNNTFPLWCYGAPTVVRDGERLYATIPEVTDAQPPMCNTRPQLFRKTGGGPWERIFANPIFDQREPCPVARVGDGQIVVSINSAITPFREGQSAQGRREVMWNCEPYLLRFDENRPGGFPDVLRPAWDSDWPFTDHSYRGLAADPETGELLVMNIEGYRWQPGPQGRYHWAFRGADGQWQSRGRLEFPLRCCYPAISLRGRRVDLIATSDVDEPNPAWMDWKRAFAGIQWDYDFRKLYYAFSENIAMCGFDAPVLVADREETAGHIRHLDLWVSADGTAHILYIARNIRQPFMRDHFWPGEPIEVTLVLARLRDGRVVDEQVITRGGETADGRLWSYGEPAGEKNTGESFRTDELVPLHGALWPAEEGRLYVVYTLGGVDEDGADHAQMFLVEAGAEGATPGAALDLRLADPMKIYFTTPPRNGSSGGRWLDLFGIGKSHPDEIRYARVSIGEK